MQRPASSLLGHLPVLVVLGVSMAVGRCWRW
jgi:hypothetical protein